MILKPSEKNEVKAVFREGIQGKQVESQLTGETETRHFCNQYRETSDTLFLPAAAQRLLETIRPTNSETVLIWKERVGKALEWRMKIDDSAQQQNRSAERVAAPPPAPSTTAAAPEKPQPTATNTPTTNRPEANTLLAAYMAALDAQLGLIEYAASQNVPLRFNEITLASSAHCLYIEACKQRADNKRYAA